MSLRLNRSATYLARVRDLASKTGLRNDVGAFSKPDTKRTKAWYSSEAQTLIVSTPAQILTATASDADMNACILIVENISSQFIEELGNAWNIDPKFFVEHARNPSRDTLWDSRHFKYTGIWDPENIASADSHHYQPFWHIDGIFEYHGVDVRYDAELDSSPNYFERHCFRSTWEEVETITSNCKISYCRARPNLSFPAPVLSYILSSSISRTNLQYLSREIRHISFRQIREPNPKINEDLHDLREDLVAFFKAGLAETITYVLPSIDEYLDELRKLSRVSMRPEQRNATDLHQKVLDDAVELEKFLMETFRLLTSSISVQGVKLSIEQGRLSNQHSLRATQLTILASVYVPLSFVTGVFGMNFRELNGSSLSIWVFFVGVVIAAIVTVMIFSGLQFHAKYRQTKKQHASSRSNHTSDQKSDPTRDSQATEPKSNIQNSMA